MDNEAVNKFMELLGQAVTAPPRKDPPGVEWNGSKITLPIDPSRMALLEGADWLMKAANAETKKVVVNETINCYPWDGAVAFNQACREIYGYTDAIPTPGMFGRQDPPAYVSIETGVGKTEQIFWGRVQLPKVPGWVQTSVGYDRGRMVFQIIAETQQKFAEVIKHLADRVREIVKTNSIYKGKAIRLHTDGNGNLDFDSAPSFLDVSRVNVDNLIFSDDLHSQIKANLFTPIVHSDLCRQNKVPLKRGVLLAGPYGTGKTLTAEAVAHLCEKHGWTYVTVERTTALKAALDFAKLFQPCVVFVEDVDREMAGERTAKMDDILNTIDGVSSKSSEIMVVLTSNAVEKINRAMLRPGRLDAVLHIMPPDAKAAERLVRLYGGRLIARDTDLKQAGVALSGMIPAVIREAVERAKLAAIALRPGMPFELTSADLVNAAATMRNHLALLAEPVKDNRTPAEVLGDALLDGINHHLGNGSDEGLSKKVKELVTKVQEMHEHII